MPSKYGFGNKRKSSPMNKNGDPKKKIRQSREEAKANIKAFGKGEGRGKGAIMSSDIGERSEARKARKAPAPPNPDKEGRIRRGPRSEGERGRGTGWAE
tara:strand:+ start:1293 stop:1589 length:297 start_codon:yes stop_codon:yes gene_type:complete